MSRPIDGDGTIRYSTGRPGREKAPAVADPPARPITPGSTAAAMAVTANRRAQWPRILSTNLIEQIHPSSGYRRDNPDDHKSTIPDDHKSPLDTAALALLRCRARSTEPGCGGRADRENFSCACAVKHVISTRAHPTGLHCHIPVTSRRWRRLQFLGVSRAVGCGSWGGRGHHEQ